MWVQLCNCYDKTAQFNGVRIAQRSLPKTMRAATHSSWECSLEAQHVASNLDLGNFGRQLL